MSQIKLSLDNGTTWTDVDGSVQIKIEGHTTPIMDDNKESRKDCIAVYEFSGDGFKANITDLNGENLHALNLSPTEYIEAIAFMAVMQAD